VTGTEVGCVDSSLTSEAGSLGAATTGALAAVGWEVGLIPGRTEFVLLGDTAAAAAAAYRIGGS